MLDVAPERSSCGLDRGGWTTIGATDAPFGRYASPVPASSTVLQSVVDAFGAAAARAEAAGFDAIELHGAHGYLLHELLSPVTNTRDDEWSGSTTARERLLLVTVTAVRQHWPATKPLLVRLSVDDVAPGGSTANDSVLLAQRLGDIGVDLIDCSTGGLVAGIDYDAFPGYQVPGSTTVRAGSGLPTSAVGLITSPTQAAEIIASGHADAVMLGRAMLRDPYWARHAAAELGAVAQLVGVTRYHRAFS